MTSRTELLSRALAGCAAALSLAPFADAQESRATSTPDAAARAEWSTDLAATLAKARDEQRPVLVFFTAAWCQPCQKLKHGVLETEDFALLFRRHRFAMVDIDSKSGKEAKAQWEVGPIPDIRFVSAKGVELGGFVGERSLEGIAKEAARASDSELREIQLRGATTCDDQRGPLPLLRLGEHLLTRPTKAPALRVLDEAIAADPDDAANVAQRAHWLIVGARFHPIGRQGKELVADARTRLGQLDRFAATIPTAGPYADAVRAWLGWNDEMTAWAERRKAGGNAELPLTVAEDAPLRLALDRLARRLEKDPDSAAAADGLLIDGLLHYYGKDYAGGLERLERFTKAFPNHRWHGEGVRFVGICRRLAAK